MTPPPLPPPLQRTRYDLPGYTLPLNFTLNTRTSNGMFPMRWTMLISQGGW